VEIVIGWLHTDHKLRAPLLRLNPSFLALFAVVVFGSPARAEMDAQTFLQHYDQAASENKLIYERILGSAENGIAWASSSVAQDHGFNIYCPPQKIALVDQQDIAIMRQHLNAHPDHRNLPYGLVLLLALKEAFPCK
jgi:hypothetical protein